MSYFKEIDEWLDGLLQYVATNPATEEVDICKQEIKAEILKSYRNGQAAAEKPAAQTPHEAPHERNSRQPAAFGAQKSVADPIAHVKFFTPDGGWTWYAAEGSQDGNEFLFFGYVVGVEAEWGYFSLAELESIRGALRLPVERDLYFTPAPMSTFIQAADRSA